MATVLFHTEKRVPGTVEQVASGISEIVLGEGTNKFAIYVLDEAANTFVQFRAGEEPLHVRAEVTSNRFRTAEHRLDEATERYLVGLGWAAPVEGGSPNFHRDFQVESEGDARHIAREGFRALEPYGWRAGAQLHERITRERRWSRLPDEPDFPKEAPPDEVLDDEDHGLLLVAHLVSETATLEVHALLLRGEPQAYFLGIGGTPDPWSLDTNETLVRHGPIGWNELVGALDHYGWVRMKGRYLHPAIAGAFLDALAPRRRALIHEPS